MFGSTVLIKINSFADAKRQFSEVHCLSQNKATFLLTLLSSSCVCAKHKTSRSPLGAPKTKYVDAMQQLYTNIANDVWI